MLRVSYNRLHESTFSDKIISNKTRQGYASKHLKPAGYFFGLAMKKRFTKPALTFAEQLTLLESRGMNIEDRDKAEFYLSHLNYYRLGAYWLPFEVEHATHRFQDGTTFEKVLNYYFFDRELRLLLMDAIERIEVSVRTNWAYALAHLHGTHSHLDENLCVSRDWWTLNLQRLKDEISRSDETFVRHFADNYREDSPPIWASCEVVSLGLLSRLYRNLKPMRTRSLISQSYRLDQSVLQSWLHHLSIIRNICAHHGRLWNREFTVTPNRPHRPKEVAEAFTQSRKLYNTLVVLTHFMDIVSPKHQFRERFQELALKYSITRFQMGFPVQWEQMSIWQPRPITDQWR